MSILESLEPRVPVAALGAIASGVDHAEGICLTPDGILHVSGEKGQIYRIDPEGVATEIGASGGWTLGLASDGAGRIVACDPARKAVLRMDPADGTWITVSTGPDAGPPLITPNWGAYGPDGTFYLSDSGGWKQRDGRLLAVRPDGRTIHLTDECRDFPNGLAITPDGRELWVLESTPGCLVAFDLRPDGSVGGRRVVLDLPGTVPDGVTFATDGSVVLACYRPDVVLRRTADGQLEILAADPEGTALAAPTNAAFFGPDLSEIAVPNIGRWHVTTFKVPGLLGAPLWYPAPEQLEY